MPYKKRQAHITACDASNSFFLEKLSNAGPAKGLIRIADTENELTIMPTMDVLAPSAVAYTGSVVFVMNAAVDWNRFTVINMTYGKLQMLSLCPWLSAIWKV